MRRMWSSAAAHNKNPWTPELLLQTPAAMGRGIRIGARGATRQPWRLVRYYLELVDSIDVRGGFRDS